MSQMGMQMPGRKRPKATSPNVYTGIMLGAVACLLFAVVLVFIEGQKVADPDKGAMAPLSIQKAGSVKLPD